jgi:hypothetical protein
VEQIIKLVTEKLGLPADKVQSLVQTVLGFLRAQAPANLASQLDSAIGAKASQLSSAGADDVAKAAQESGLSAPQLKSVVETVLGFLKSKLPAEAFQQIEGQVSGLLSGGGLLEKLKGLFSGS